MTDVQVQLTYYPFHSIVSWDAETEAFLVEVQTGRYTSREFVFETPEAPLMDEILFDQVKCDQARQEDIDKQIKEEKKRNVQAKEERERSRKLQKDNRDANGNNTVHSSYV